MHGGETAYDATREEHLTPVRRKDPRHGSLQEPDGRGLELHDQIKVLDKMINAGGVDAYRWREIETLMLTRQRLVRSERKRQVEAKLVISMEQAQLAMVMFVDAAKEAVGHDERAKGKIVEAFSRLTGRADAHDIADGAIESSGRDTQIDERPDA
jgi:hypothetical protein